MPRPTLVTERPHGHSPTTEKPATKERHPLTRVGENRPYDRESPLEQRHSAQSATLDGCHTPRPQQSRTAAGPSYLGRDFGGRLTSFDRLDFR